MSHTPISLPTAPNDGDTIAYNATSGEFEAQASSGGPSILLRNHQDQTGHTISTTSINKFVTLPSNAVGLYYFDYDAGTDKSLTLPAGASVQGSMVIDVSGTLYAYCIAADGQIFRYDLTAVAPVASVACTIVGQTIGSAAFINTQDISFDSINSKAAIAHSSRNSTTAGVIDIYNINHATNTWTLEKTITPTTYQDSSLGFPNIVLDGDNLYHQSSTISGFTNKYEISTDTETTRTITGQAGRQTVQVDGVWYMNAVAETRAHIGPYHEFLLF